MVLKTPSKDPAPSVHGVPSAHELGQHWTPLHDTLNTSMALDNKAGHQPISALELARTIRDIPGFDVNAIDALGSNRLIYAAAACSIAHLQALQDFGANLHLRNLRGVSVIHLNISSTVVRWLVDQNVDVNARTLEGDTPLHLSAKSKTTHLQALLDAGADVHAKNNQGMTPLHQLAHSYHQAEVVSASLAALVAADADLEARDGQGRTALHHAVTQSRYSVICALIEAGTDPEATDAWGLRPIQLAVASDNERNIFTLNAMGASMRGTVSNKKKLDGFLHEPRLISAIRSDNMNTMMRHLQQFPKPGPEDLAAAKKLLKRLGGVSMQSVLDEHLAIINARLAMLAVESVLQGAAPSPCVRGPQ